MTIYSIDVLLFLFGTSLLFHVQFYLLLLDLHTDFSGGRSAGLVFHFFKNFPQFVVIYTEKGFGVVNHAEVDVFLELSCFCEDPADVGNLISGSSEPQFAPVLFLLTVQSFSIFGYKEHNKIDFSIDHR